MITIGNIGRFESIPQILNDVLNENISALEEHLLKGWKLNKEIRVGKYTDLSPLDFALIMEKFQSIKWLTEKGANLNAKEHPSFLLAVRYCNEEVIRYLVSHGAKIDVTNNVGSEAFLEAYYGTRCTTVLNGQPEAIIFFGMNTLFIFILMKAMTLSLNRGRLSKKKRGGKIHFLNSSPRRDNVVIAPGLVSFLPLFITCCN